VLRGLEALLESMEVGEVCEGELQAAWAYGDQGLERCGVKGGEKITATVTMVAGAGAERAKSLSDMSARERFVEAGACKESGNAFFKEAKLQQAAAEYRKCLRFVEYVFYRPREAATSDASSVTGEECEDEVDVSDSAGAAVGPPEGGRAAGEGGQADGDDGFVEAGAEPEPEPEPAADDDPAEAEVRDLHVACLNNLSLCLLKTGDHRRVVEMASLSTQMDPLNHKPLFYRGRARHALGDWDEAKADLYAAAKLAPKMFGIRIEIDKLNKKMQQHMVRERKVAAAMFG
jgi:tetratricopeptide (TPR) repeat protein